MARGRLRIYLGAAPGVGKTYAMLGEGNRRAERGTDVVIGYVETHGRAHTAAEIGDLAVVPRRAIAYRGTTVEEMDVDAVLARNPQVALVDELAHTNVPGSRNVKRWEDVEELLAAGIDVISTVNIQHLASLNDVVTQITGVTQRETVPDAVVRQADQIELVDMSPEALRRRMAHGNIYPAERIDASLANYFRVGNLTALRELGLLWVADQVESALSDYRSRHGIAQPWETRERVAVAVTGAPGSDRLIRRAARIATRTRAELVGIHVEPADGLTADGTDSRLDEHRRLLVDLGGRYRGVVDGDIGRALVRTALAEGATQLIIGSTRRSRWAELVRGSVVNRIAQEAGGALDVHIISAPAGRTSRRHAAPRRDRRTNGEARATAAPGPLAGAWRRLGMRRSVLPPRRRAAAAVAVGLGLPLLTALLLPLADRLGFTTVGFMYLLAVVAIAVTGGRTIGIAGAVAGFLLLNWFFAPPVHTLTLANERDAIAVVAFLTVGSVVSVLVERTARRSVDAARARREAEALVTMAAVLLREDDPLPDLLAVLVATFALEGVALLEPAGPGWVSLVAGGPAAPTDPAGATLVVPVGDHTRLAVSGSLSPDDRRVLSAFATQLAVALEGRRLRIAAARSAEAARAGEVRDAILAAVSHDLRTPLTTIKTSASALRDPHLALDDDARAELLAAIDSESDHLNALVGNLLDLGRLRSDALAVQRRPTHLAELVGALVHRLPHEQPVDVAVEDDLAADADPVLLERALANVLSNAFRYAPPDSQVAVRGAPLDGHVELRVVDHGPGIPRAQRRSVFAAFQRLDDRPEQAGVGLGLTVARGFVEAMDGGLDIDETPGGGTTMVITLPAVAP
jgi:two-component system sensor histidine kinase KdpD